MSFPKILSITEARNNIFELAEQVQRPGAYFTLTEKGRAKAVLMSADEFDSWAETLEVIKDFPNLKEDIKTARAEYKRGDYITLDELLTKAEFVVADKSKNKYGIPGRSAKKGTKRSRKN